MAGYYLLWGMDIFELTVGVALGVIVAATFLWCVRTVVICDNHNEKPPLRHLIFIVAVLVMILLYAV